MATQADWRMMLGIRQQPNQWAEALSNLPGNLMQGMQIGDYFRERSRENQLQELMRGAIDPQTGEVDTGKALGALMQFDPATGIKLMQQDRLARMQSEGLQVAMSGNYTPEERQILQGYAATGDIGKGIAKIGELRYGRSVTSENRAQDLVPGLDESGRPVTRTRAEWQVPRGTPAPVGDPAPGGTPAPATGQLIGPESPPVAGAPSMDLPIDMIRNLPPADRAKLYSQLTPGQVANINLALSEPGTVTAQTPFAPPQRNKSAPGVPGIPGGPAPVGPAPVGPAPVGPAPVGSAPVGPAPVGSAPVSGIRTGLSEEEKQAFKIQEERRAEQRRIEEEGRAAQRRVEEEGRSIQNKIAEEARSRRDKGLSSGDQAWVNEVFSPALKEHQQNSLVLSDLTTMERLNKEGKTGPGSEFQLTLKRGLVAAGMLDPKAVATEQQIIAMSNALTWNTLAQQKGPQTNFDFERMQVTWPNILNAGDANQFLIDSKKAILSRRQQQIEFYRNNFTDAVKAGNVLGLEDAWAKTPAAQKSIWDEPIMRKWSLKYPMPGQPQEESQSGELKFNHPQQNEIDKIKAQLRGGR